MKVSRNAHRDEHTICEKLYGRVGFVFFWKPVFFHCCLLIYLFIYLLFSYLFIIYLFIFGGRGG